MFSRPFIGMMLVFLFGMMFYNILTGFSGCEDSGVKPPETYGEVNFDRLTNSPVVNYNFPEGYVIDTITGHIHYLLSPNYITNAHGFCLIVNYKGEIKPFFYLDDGSNLTNEIIRFDSDPQVDTL